MIITDNIIHARKGYPILLTAGEPYPTQVIFETPYLDPKGELFVHVWLNGEWNMRKYQIPFEGTQAVWQVPEELFEKPNRAELQLHYDNLPRSGFFQLKYKKDINYWESEAFNLRIVSREEIIVRGEIV